MCLNHNVHQEQYHFPVCFSQCVLCYFSSNARSTLHFHIDSVSSRHAVSKRMWIGGVVLALRHFCKQLSCNSAETCLQKPLRQSYNRKALRLGNGTATRRPRSNASKMELRTELQTCFCGCFFFFFFQLKSCCYICRLEYLRLPADVLSHVKLSD